MGDKYKDKLIIPPDQRQYVWGISREKTVEDFIDSIYSGSQFFGTILVQQNGSEYFIWDGQQRIITITLIMAYIWNRGGIDQAFRTRCLESIYRLTEQGNTFYPLIQLYGKTQQQTLINIMQDCLNRIEDPYTFKGFTEGLTPNKSIMDAFSRIKRKIDKEILNDPQYLSKLKQKLKTPTVLRVGIIRGTESDNCPSIFRALNSAGLKLTDLDLTKQFLFQKLRRVKSKEDIYEYWVNIVNNCKVHTKENLNKDMDEVNKKSLNDFFKIYTGILGKDDSTDKYFKYFESLCRNISDNDIKNLMCQILQYSNIYYTLKHENFNALSCKLSAKSIKIIRQYIDGVLYFGHSRISFSYLPATLGMYIFKLCIDLKLHETKIVQIFTNLINTHIRYMIKHHGTVGSTNRYCTQIISNLQQQNITPDNIVSILNKHLYKYQVEDEEITPQIHEKIVPFILIHINKATRDNLGINQYTIEHIMPKTRSNTPWQKQTNMLSNKQYEYSIKSIGNLVLIPKSLNSKLSNKGFKQKLGILTKVENEIFTTINKDVYFNSNGVYKSQWTVDDINERANTIVNKINATFTKLREENNA